MTNLLTFGDFQNFPVASAADGLCLGAAGAKTQLLVLPLETPPGKALLAWQSQGVGGNRLPPSPNKEHTWEEMSQRKESSYQESKRKFSGSARRPA